jgi:hypothetical protein
MLAFEGVPVPKALSPPVAAALTFHILGAQALAYFLWFTVIARLPAGIASLGTLMVPAVGERSARCCFLARDRRRAIGSGSCSSSRLQVRSWSRRNRVVDPGVNFFFVPPGTF